MYKIRILKNNCLLFATDPNSIKTIHQLVDVFKILDKKFPEAEGYSLEVDLLIKRVSRSDWQLLLPYIEHPHTVSIHFILSKLI